MRLPTAGPATHPSAADVRGTERARQPWLLLVEGNRVWLVPKQTVGAGASQLTQMCKTREGQRALPVRPSKGLAPLLRGTGHSLLVMRWSQTRCPPRPGSAWLFPVLRARICRTHSQRCPPTAYALPRRCLLRQCPPRLCPPPPVPTAAWGTPASRLTGYKRQGSCTFLK